MFLRSFAALSFIVASASAQLPTQCPQIMYDGTSIVGSWEGYMLSTQNNGTIHRANVGFEFDYENSTNTLTAELTISDPDGESSINPCKGYFKVNCLVSLSGWLDHTSN